MAHEGASVVVADIDGSAAERVAGELESAVVAEVDVSDEAGVVRMVETAIASFGGLDMLHNNATDSRRRSTASSAAGCVPPTERPKPGSCS
jgi:NAD(P)-dependent dehydrogenase (short-subunit alcohol dehydrogenase family)